MRNAAKYPAVWLAIFQSAGIALARYSSAPLCFSLLILLPMLLLFRWRRHRHLLLLAVFSLSVSAVFYAQRNVSLEHPLDGLLPLQNVTLAGKIDRAGGTTEQRLIVYVDSLQLGDKWLPVKRRVYFKPGNRRKINDEASAVVIQNVRLDKRLFPRNPGQFNFGEYLAGIGVWAYGAGDKNSRIVEIPASDKIVAGFSIFHIRNLISARIELLFSGENAGFVNGILLGVSDRIPSEIKNQFRQTGVAHVLAISGLHVGFIALALGILLSFLNLKSRSRNSVIILSLWFYVLLAGGRPSVTRAALMITFYLAGKILERKSQALNSIAAAYVLILLFDPRQLFAVGFQYSFAAVLAILWLYPKLQKISPKLTPDFLPPAPRLFYQRWILGAFFISFAAQIGSIPLTAYYFRHFSLISFLLNIIVIPLVGLILMTSICSLVASLFSFAAGDAVARITEFLISGLFRLVALSARIPFNSFELPAISLAAILIYLSVVLLAVYREKIPAQLRRAVIPLMVFISVMLIIPGKPALQYIVFDVGQGESALVKTPAGKVALYDAGPAFAGWDSGENIILPALKHLNISKIDKVFLSHPHNDHIGGFFKLFGQVRIDSVYLPEVDFNYPPLTRLLQFLNANKIAYRKLIRGEIIPLDAGSKIYVLGPSPENCRPDNFSGHAVNNTSLVLKFRCGETGILFPGDAEKDVESELLAWGDFLKSDLMLAGHHGSKTSNSEAFLRRIQPDRCFITVGGKNRYGHPSPEILRRLAQFNIEFSRTDEGGAIWLAYRNGQWRDRHWR